MPETETKTKRVVHPDFADQVREVPADSAKDWTDSGWLLETDKVAKDREAEAAAIRAADLAATAGGVTNG